MSLLTMGVMSNHRQGRRVMPYSMVCQYPVLTRLISCLLLFRTSRFPKNY